MRDFRDAKAMAQTLRESLSHKAMTISHSESLELVSKMLGVADWNTLAAMLQAGRGESTKLVPRLKARYPAIPLRDLVPFPGASYPLFVGRDKTINAVEQAWEGEREVVLAVQREAGSTSHGSKTSTRSVSSPGCLRFARLPTVRKARSRCWCEPSGA